MLDSLFGNTPVLETALNGLSARTRAIGENVANADTPGYKRMEVSFEGQLRRKLDKQQSTAADNNELDLATSSPRHFSLGPDGDTSQVQARMYQINDQSYRQDKNNVDIEMEMANLAETNVRYNTLSTLTKTNFDQINTTLKDLH